MRVKARQDAVCFISSGEAGEEVQIIVRVISQVLELVRVSGDCGATATDVGHVATSEKRFCLRHAILGPETHNIKNLTNNVLSAERLQAEFS
jgi:hypothetical protein